MHLDLRTEFELAAPRLAVYQAVRDVLAWPTWWRGCLAVAELARGDERGIGAQRRIVWRSALRYHLTIEMEVTAIERGSFIQARSNGDLHGAGAWRLTDVPGGTHVAYLWRVVVVKPWMRRTAPLLAPLFRINHDWLMTAGAHGMARHLGVPRPRVRHCAGAAAQHGQDTA